MLATADSFDPMLSQLRQAVDLSPDSTPRLSHSHSNNSNDERWADIAIDAPCSNNVVQTCEQQATKKDEWAVQAFVDESDMVYTTEDLDSVGSRLHDSGRCKPCAFFHTKGCNSGNGCLFCHRCPAHEKQRRKRLRRQLCHSLLNSFDGRGGRSQGESRLAHPTKAGHTRIVSSDTTSTCSGWSNADAQFAHSRGSSTSSQATGMYEHSEANLGYVQSPTGMYGNAQPPMMSPSNNMQPVMFQVGPPGAIVMQPCNESWNEAAPNEAMESMPMLEAQTLSPNGSRDMDDSFAGAGGVINSMPPVPAGKLHALQCQEPPPPPSGLPTVPTMPQAQPALAMQSPTQRSEQTSPTLSLPAGACEQPSQQMQGMSVSPVGYMTCGNYQYALVPVPVQQYDNGAAYAVSPTAYNGSPVNQQQQWGPYEEYGHVMTPTYQPEQRCFPGYEAVAVENPMQCAVGGSSQWW